MIIVETDEAKRLAEQNTALISLLEKVHAMLRPYRGQGSFNGELYRVIDLELFKAKIIKKSD